MDFFKKIKLKNTITLGIYLWIFLLPWQTRYFYQASLKGYPWEAGSLSLYITEVLLILLLVIRFIVWVKENNRIDIKKIPVFVCLLIAFVLYVLFFSWWSVFPALSIYWALKLGLVLGVFWLIRTSQLDFGRVVLVLVAAGMLQGLLAISQFLFQYVPANKWLGLATQDPRQLGVSVVDTGYRRWLRAYGTFPHPNILGGFLVVCLGFCLYLVDFLEKSWQKFKSKKTQILQSAALISLLLIVSGLALSFSRAAWLAAVLLFGLLAGFAIFKKPVISGRTLVHTIVLTIVCTMLWVSVYPQPFITRLQASERLEVNSTNERLNSYDQAIDLWQEKPWLGVGVGAYSFALYEKNLQSYPWQLQPVHNVFLLIASELGIVGLLLWLAMLIWLFVKYFPNYFSLTIYSIVIFLMLFDHWWWSLSMGLYFTFFLLALLFFQKKKISTK